RGGGGGGGGGGGPRGLPPADRGDLQSLVFQHQPRLRAPQGLLQLLGVGRRRPEADRDVVGDVVAAQRDDRGVPDRVLAEERHVGGAAADVDHHHPQVALVGG